jgi:hypothetical protein
MKLELVENDEVVEEDKRNSKWRYLETDAVCVICGCINNHRYYDSCIICKCKCGNSEFIHGKLSIDLRLLMDFHIEELKSLCEIRGIGVGTRSGMVVRLLKQFYMERFDERINEQLIKKIMVRNKKKFRFAIDITDAVQKVKREIKLELVKKEDVLDE